MAQMAYLRQPGHDRQAYCLQLLTELSPCGATLPQGGIITTQQIFAQALLLDPPPPGPPSP